MLEISLLQKNWRGMHDAAGEDRLREAKDGWTPGSGVLAFCSLLIAWKLLPKIVSQESS